MHVCFNMRCVCLHTLLHLALVCGVLARPSGLQLNALETTKSEKGREVWLDDITKDYLYEMQGDSPIALGQPTDMASGICPPPPPDGVHTSGCKADNCTADLDCQGPQERCCNNGCGFTCVSFVQHPPIIDWIREPPRNAKTGYSWLIPHTAEDVLDDETVEWCSTNMSLEDEDPLLCPHGYQCRIEDPGSPEEGIPNRGRCVSEVLSSESEQTIPFETSDQVDGHCIYGNREMEEGTSFLYNGHSCVCLGGSVECIVKESGQPPR